MESPLKLAKIVKMTVFRRISFLVITSGLSIQYNTEVVAGKHLLFNEVGQSYDDKILELDSYETHPCTRPCQNNGESPMVCEYDFVMEHYLTLSRACFNCPFVKEDCFRPHCISADGNRRGVLAVNRRLPGPSINVCVNDTIRVRVHNKLEMGEAVTIHWHGVVQKNTNYMDGVAMITQCPIPSQTSFTYTFLAGNPGTHFWHSHSGLQRGDGIFGSLVIRQPPAEDVHRNMYDVDDPKYTLLLHDWLEQDIGSSYALHYHYDNQLNKPVSLLINGRGTYTVFDDVNQNINDNNNNNNITTPRLELTLRHGQRYRFRLIGGLIQQCPIRISVDDHMITLISSDGRDVEPMDVGSFTIYGGERYDFVLTANQSNVSTYLMRFIGKNMCSTNFESVILRYEGALLDSDSEDANTRYYNEDEDLRPELNPYTDESHAPKLQITDLRAMESNVDDRALTKPVDKKFTLAYDFAVISNPRFYNKDFYPIEAFTEENLRIFTPKINNMTMILPPSPLLSQFDDVPKDIFCDDNHCPKVKVKGEENDVMCDCIPLLKVDLYDVVEVIIIDEGRVRNMTHPMHLHGHGFRVVAMDKLGHETSASTVAELDASGKIKRNLDRAPIKDTVHIYDGGYTVIRFYADNPGIWLFHCHIAYHTEIGMGVLFQVGDRMRNFPSVPDRFPQCGSWDGGIIDN